ncbi:unnamed protein product [Lactuca virosa]|uniref:Uncharacterized protein n=1 Tax=Lactuca virosa TaxID=75947 RepID=A0AAU9P3R7_9ASTR|nr:unnamed protein product [Lactuca virosa]
MLLTSSKPSSGLTCLVSQKISRKTTAKLYLLRTFFQLISEGFLMLIPTIIEIGGLMADVMLIRTRASWLWILFLTTFTSKGSCHGYYISSSLISKMLLTATHPLLLTSRRLYGSGYGNVVWVQMSLAFSLIQKDFHLFLIRDSVSQIPWSV